MLNRLSALPALAALAALSACQGGIGNSLDSRQNAGPCPVSGSLYEASRIVELDGGIQFSNITYTGEITDVELFCRYAGDDPLTAELQLDFAFGKGPLAASDSHTYTYWVAVTRRNGTVLARETFTVEADFSNGPVDAEREVISSIIIPRVDESISGVNFEILVGFELTDDQLQFNREGRRFRLDAGSGLN